MTQRSASRRLFVFPVLAGLAVVGAGDALARTQRVDEGNNFTALGTAMVRTGYTGTLADFDINVTPNYATLFDATFPSDTTGIQVDFGDGLLHNVTLYQNGYLSFGANPPPLDTSGGLPDGVIAPFYFDNTVHPAVETSYTQGLVDLTSPFDIADAVDSFRATWKIPADDPTQDFVFQVVLYDRSKGGAAGDFDLEINYSGSDLDGLPPLAELLGAGFHLGAYTFALPTDPGNAADSFDGNAHDYDFSFRGGKLVGSPPTQVPEPDSLALMCAGLLAIAAAVARRRRAPQLAR